MVYNDWTVIDDKTIRKNGHLYLKCKCKCGLEKEVQITALKAGKSKRCSSCAGKLVTLSEGFKKSWKGKSIGVLNRTMFGHIRSKASERNLEFTVDQQYLSDLFEEQNRICALSGIDITLSSKIKNGNPDFSFVTASLDRIDSKKGYIKGNIQWVHKDLNKMKMAYDKDYFIKMCKLVAEHNR